MSGCLLGWRIAEQRGETRGGGNPTNEQIRGSGHLDAVGKAHRIRTGHVLGVLEVEHHAASLLAADDLVESHVGDDQIPRGGAKQNLRLGPPVADDGVRPLFADLRDRAAGVLAGVHVSTGEGVGV
ncbi:hypothetical protein EB118_21470, partial [bacterium]|nr:hypothetical protein [bacterium]